MPYEKYTTKPMTSHTTRRSHVSRGRPAMTTRHAMAPAGAMTHGIGTRKGRATLGLVMRRIGMPTHTSTKASRVPMETSSPTRDIGMMPAHTPTKTPFTTVAT